ncbi:ATP-binding cassette domain-containing protein [Paenibacillus glycanilyticus]|uniref:ABC transporter ATP-binding protein n=1 Tax=Paenibacillus glycanilyticus TaxID=126569 RepID=UPI00203D4A64|nr:ATP-binding cassette domain-containing protein [Paenibacillus glycanilyticus]MCM3628620.1 ATP-binding cassette domain-containing protein [Paenibacillus glycanilyticus]
MIEVRNLTKTYMTHERGHTFREVTRNLIKRPMKEIKAVHDLSFTVPQGEMLAFLGPNGAGKSTTLKILTGVLHPTAGEVKALGLIPWKQRRQYVGRIGAVFGQKSQLLWDIPPVDAFYMNKAIYGVPEQQYKSTLDELTELLNVGSIIRKPTRQLSLGERMKCEFIMAMLHRPEIVFLDEPTIGLDMIAKENIRHFIRSMNSQGVTFILTTHDLEDVEMLAERVIVINHGEIVVDDSLGVLRSRLGDKKSVRLTTEAVVPDIRVQGITITERMGPLEIALEIDTTLLPLKRFIREFNEVYGIVDMAIDAIPIESIMKELYMNDSAVETAAGKA